MTINPQKFTLSHLINLPFLTYRILPHIVQGKLYAARTLSIRSKVMQPSQLFDTSDIWTFLLYNINLNICHLSVQVKATKRLSWHSCLTQHNPCSINNSHIFPLILSQLALSYYSLILLFLPLLLFSLCSLLIFIFLLLPLTLFYIRKWQFLK